MTFKNISSLFLLSFIAFCSYYLLSRFDWQPEKQIPPDKKLPLFTSDVIKTTNYDADGLRNYLLESKQLEHFSTSNETFFERPLLHTFVKGVEKEWQVSANSAILKDKHILVMQDNVNIYNLLPDTQIKTIKTQKLTLNLTSGDFWTESDTFITGSNFETQGARATGNFNLQTMKLLEKVKTIYESKIN